MTTDGSFASLVGAPVDATVTYTVRNSGNVRLTPKVDLKVGGIFGVASKSAPTLTLPELLPGGSATLTQAIDGVLPTGRITATVDAKAGNTSATGSASTWAVPWLLLGVIVALIVGLWWNHRRRRAPRAAAPAYADLDKAGSRG